MTSRETAFEMAWPLTVGALALFALGGPAMRYADPFALTGIAVMIGLTAMLSHFSISAESDRWTRIWGVLTMIGLVTTTYLLTRVLGSANAASNANDARCLVIQRDMLSAHPRRDDGPDLFQALGCRPQGEGSVYATVKNISQR